MVTPFFYKIAKFTPLVYIIYYTYSNLIHPRSKLAIENTMKPIDPIMNKLCPASTYAHGPLPVNLLSMVMLVYRTSPPGIGLSVWICWTLALGDMTHLLIKYFLWAFSKFFWSLTNSPITMKEKNRAKQRQTMDTISNITRLRFSPFIRSLIASKVIVKAFFTSSCQFRLSFRLKHATYRKLC